MSGEPAVHAPGPVINERPGPRVLVEIDGKLLTPAFAERLAETVPTVAWDQYLSRFNLSEWDCVITSGSTTTVQRSGGVGDPWQADTAERYEWRDDYPGHMSVVTIVYLPERRYDHDAHFLAFDPPSGRGAEVAGVAVVSESGKVGAHIALPTGLPERLERLVRRELVPAVERREFHRTFSRGGNHAPEQKTLRIRPFLYGPDDSVLAGSIERNLGASLWFLPGDIPDAYPWVTAALTEWHEKYPDRFPALPDWGNSPAWQSARELDIAARLDENFTWFKEQYRVYNERDATLTAQMASAKAEADSYERALLTGDGEVLEEAVGCALAELGFIVVAMDEIWPAGQRKEDLRVVDPDSADWLAIVEIKGFTGGVRETGFQSLLRWGQFYVQETGGMPSVSWYVANGFRRDDPSTRPEPYLGRPDALDVVEEAGGLVIDTRALFDLVRAVRQEPDRAPTARTLLRNASGLVVRCSADLLASPNAEEAS